MPSAMLSDELDGLQLDGDDSMEVPMPAFHYNWDIESKGTEPVLGAAAGAAGASKAMAPSRGGTVARIEADASNTNAPQTTHIGTHTSTSTNPPPRAPTQRRLNLVQNTPSPHGPNISIGSIGSAATYASGSGSGSGSGYGSYGSGSGSRSGSVLGSASSGHVLTDTSTISGGSVLTPPEGVPGRYRTGLAGSVLGRGYANGNGGAGGGGGGKRHVTDLGSRSWRDEEGDEGGGEGVGYGASGGTANANGHGNASASGDGSAGYNAGGGSGEKRRTFQRVVSAPIARTSPVGDDSRLTAYTQTRPPLTHSSSGNTSTTITALNAPTTTTAHATTHTHPHTALGNTLNAHAHSTTRTPGLTDRTGSASLALASTSRRLGNLARFGPARRVPKGQEDVEEESGTPPLISSPKPLVPSPPPRSPPLLRPIHERSPPPQQSYPQPHQHQAPSTGAGPSRRPSPPREVRAYDAYHDHDQDHDPHQDYGRGHLVSRMPSPPPVEIPFRPFESQSQRQPERERAHAYSYSHSHADARQRDRERERDRDPHYVASRAAPVAPTPAMQAPIPPLHPAPPLHTSASPPIVQAAPPAHTAIINGKRTFVVNGKAYERISMLGRGGSSKVYSVLCQQTRSMFAMKRVMLDRADHETIQSYTNEIELLRRLNGHDRIIKLIDYQVTYGNNNRPKALQMVLECGEIDFALLLDEQRGLPLNMNFVGMYWGQMLEAVQAVHLENVVHTDLKPANFVLVKGRLKIIDFGIAKAVANDTVNIQRDQQIGTVNYMSPEAVQKMNNLQVHKLSYPSDVWSLGCILYQMVYGNLPFAHIGGGPLQKMNAIADPSHRILYPETATAQVPPQPGQGQGREADEAKAQAQAWTVTIPPAAIDAIKRCLMYRSNQRLTIPELLVHEFLRPKLASQTGAGLPLGATAITEQQMTRMYNWILDQHGIEVKPGDQTAADLFGQLTALNALTP